MARAFLESVAATAADPDRLEVILYVDDDDPASASIAHANLRTTTIVGAPVTMGAANSACLARSTGAIVMLANDDLIAVTPGWDAEIRRCHATFEDEIYLAWINDRFTSRRISTFPILSRTACDLLVEPFPSVYRSALIDCALFDIFSRLRRLGHDRLVYLKHVVLEHRHHRTGKRPPDDTTRRHLRFEDDTTFVTRSAGRQRQAERLAAVVEHEPVAPCATPEPEAFPGGVGAAIALCAQTFLGDAGLPLSRRAYMFLWFCGRAVVAGRSTGTRRALTPRDSLDARTAPLK